MICDWSEHVCCWINWTLSDCANVCSLQADGSTDRGKLARD